MPTATYKEKKNIEAKYISIELCIDYIYLLYIFILIKKVEYLVGNYSDIKFHSKNFAISTLMTYERQL